MGPANEEQKMIPHDDGRIHQLHVPGMVEIDLLSSGILDQEFGDMVC